MQEKGLISFNAGSLQGPEGLWGHHISGMFDIDRSFERE